MVCHQKQKKDALISPTVNRNDVPGPKGGLTTAPDSFGRSRANAVCRADPPKKINGI